MFLVPPLLSLRVPSFITLLPPSSNVTILHSFVPQSGGLSKYSCWQPLGPARPSQASTLPSWWQRLRGCGYNWKVQAHRLQLARKVFMLYVARLCIRLHYAFSCGLLSWCHTFNVWENIWQIFIYRFDDGYASNSTPPSDPCRRRLMNH